MLNILGCSEEMVTFQQDGGVNQTIWWQQTNEVKGDKFEVSQTEEILAPN